MSSLDAFEEDLKALRQAYRLMGGVRHIAYGDPAYTEHQRRELNALSESLHGQFRQAIVVHIQHGLESGLYRATLNWRGNPCFVELSESDVQKRLYRCVRESESISKRMSYEKCVNRDYHVKSRGYKRQQRSGKHWHT